MSKPTTRVLALLELLQSHRRLTGSDIARRLNVETRTVRRYITALEELGIPVTTEQGRYGGYSLIAGYKLPPMMFTNEEAQAIALGLLAAGQLGLREATPAITSVQAKLQRVMPTKLQQQLRAISESISIQLPNSNISDNSQALMLITEATQSRQQIHFLYQTQTGETTMRTIDPYGLVYRHGRWYACGYCHLRQDLRTFRIDRLSNTRLLQTQFNRPADFDAAKYLHRSIMTAPRKHPIRIVLHTDLDQAMRAFGDIEALLQQEEDGLLLRTTTESISHFARWLAYLSFSFTIVEPRALKQAVRKHAQQLLSMTK